MQKWDYKSIKYGSDGDFIEAGQKGWELVTMINTTSHVDHSPVIFGMFKRPIEN